jgi:twitching motility protein PilT
MHLIDKYLTDMLEKGGSDLHLCTGQPAKYRIHGSIGPADDHIIDAAEMEAMLKEICLPASRWETYLKIHDMDLAYEIPDVARFRCSYFYNYYGMGGVFRQIPSKILTAKQLNLPSPIIELCGTPSGLILVTGPTGSGKSTTLAAMIDYINDTASKHIITLENPIEFVHKNKNCTIVHREIGLHSKSFPNALRGAMRSDPDIVLIGEMRDLDTIRLGLTCASMGMLVFSTLHTNSAPKTVDRIIDAFPANEQMQIRTLLAECLQGVVSQQLCKKIGGGRIASHEILLYTDALPNTIREGQIANIKTIIEANRGRGMISMDNNLMRLLEEGLISTREAYMKASDKKVFQELLAQEAGEDAPPTAQ